MLFPAADQIHAALIWGIAYLPSAQAPTTGGIGVLTVDGKVVARHAMEHTIPLIMQWDENFDIGADKLAAADCEQNV